MLKLLIFTVPQLIAWLRKKERGLSLLPLITLLAMLCSFWSFFITRFLGQKITFILEETSNWIILAGLLYLFFVSVPDWLSVYFRQTLSRTKEGTQQ